ncbi:MAG: hypothetical protein NC341_05865 [Blautia sp.]|nr:hypothetical protein [Blautia sp.]MCM1199982.1 hypothetical protein [Bacteroides fragilis]
MSFTIVYYEGWRDARGKRDVQSGRAVYQADEITAADFSFPLQAGKVYQIYMKWDKEKINENGCSGTAYYVFGTAPSVQEGRDTEAGDSVK